MSSNVKGILIIGASGFIGTHLALSLRRKHRVYGTYYRHRFRIPGVCSIPMNLDNSASIKAAVKLAHPEVIVYAAGISNADLANHSPDDAIPVHVGGVSNVLTLVEIIQPKFIYISSAHVFDGIRGNYHEAEAAFPGTPYGKMKFDAENILRTKSINYLILRSSPALGRGNGYNLSWIDRLRMSFDHGKPFELPTHEVHNFTWMRVLAEAVERLVDIGAKNKPFHLGGLTKLSYYQLGQILAKAWGYDPRLAVPRPPKALAHSKMSAPPLDTVLDYSLNSTHLAETLRVKPLLLESGL
jgi:dTDP-4-dehydrorhamnose reductase